MCISLRARLECGKSSISWLLHHAHVDAIRINIHPGAAITAALGWIFLRLDSVWPVDACHPQKDAKSPLRHPPHSDRRESGHGETITNFTLEITRAPTTALCRGAALDVRAENAVCASLYTRSICSLEMQPSSWLQLQGPCRRQRSSSSVPRLKVARQPPPCAGNEAGLAYLNSPCRQPGVRGVYEASTFLPPAPPASR